MPQRRGTHHLELGPRGGDMSAPLHTRSTPRTRGAGATLPWWAVVLPAIAFALLLMLVLDPSGTPAPTGDSAIVDHLGHIRRSLPF